MTSSSDPSPAARPTPDRDSTGVEGLDDILRGGLPRHRVYLVRGTPGVGKTTLSLEFLRAGAAEGERVLYVTLSETRDEISQVADSHGWTLEGATSTSSRATSRRSGSRPKTRCTRRRTWT